MTRTHTLALTFLACLGAACDGAPPEVVPEQDAAPMLLGRALLPALTFAVGPSSGARLMPDPPPAPPGTLNGVPLPFASQPVQGFSAIIAGNDDTVWVMPDNGYGSRETSDDFLLRVYHVAPHFKTADGGSGEVGVNGFIALSDSLHRVSFPITREASGDRLMTGADFDPECFRRDRRGGLWFGDEFGPYLIHTDDQGVILDDPIELPDPDSPSGFIRSPQNRHLLSDEAPTLDRSSGFEGMGQWDGFLYPMLEGPLEKDVAAGDAKLRRIYEFDSDNKRYTGRQWKYRTRDDFMSVHDLTSLDRDRLLATETDDNEGQAAISEPARHKKIYLIDLRRVDADGILIKEEVADLLNLRDPASISLPGRPGDVGLGDPFAFPFITIEGVLPLGGDRLLVINDNNLPFSLGRNSTLPDPNEFVVLRAPAILQR